MAGFSNKKVAVLGMGESGRAAARWLYGEGAVLACYDVMDEQHWDAGFLSWCRECGIRTVSGERPGMEAFSNCSLAVASPGIAPGSRIIREISAMGIPVIGELALAAGAWKGMLIGITGTNGKTTTTALVSHLLDSAGIPNVKAGNISPPLSAVMHKNDGRTVAVLEISSFQLEYFPVPWAGMARPPKFAAAILLNIAPDHLDRYADIDGYLRAKLRIFSFQEAGGWAIMDAGLLERVGQADSQLFLLGVQQGGIGARWDMDSCVMELSWPEGRVETYSLSGWRLRGEHNLQNLSAAIAAARIAGANMQGISRGIESFTAPRHRLEHLMSKGPIELINDSKATNMAALIAALKALDGDITLIAGGRGKGEGMEELQRFLRSCQGNGTARVKRAVFIGEEGPRLMDAMKPFLKECRLVHGNDGHEVMKEAVRLAYSMSSPGSKVLLSPACASFDLFSSYRERGEVFMEAVKRL